jgi:O-methyltransferase involved in polyketide biosynthesis
MATGKIQFTKEKETMLMTLYGRALQSQWEHPILRDPWAEEAVRHIDYDFRKLYGYRGVFGHLVSGLGCTIIATRASTFDRETTRYLADHPEATVLHLGCGLDSRVFRVDPPASVTWFDVDYPDVIGVRRQLFPERPNYHLVGLPLEDMRWLNEVAGGRPVLVVAEGVLMYLSEANVKALLNAVTGHFPSGQLVFDALHPWVVRRTGSNVGGTGASYRWGLDEPRDITRLDPKLELVKEYTRPELVGYPRFPLAVRAVFLLLDNVPALRRMERLLVYRF